MCRVYCIIVLSYQSMAMIYGSNINQELNWCKLNRPSHTGPCNIITHTYANNKLFFIVTSFNFDMQRPQLNQCGGLIPFIWDNP
jgi:hypothetical protein